MVKILNNCAKCGACIQICPTRSISIKETQKFINETCEKCYACVSICPLNALTKDDG